MCLSVRDSGRVTRGDVETGKRRGTSIERLLPEMSVENQKRGTTFHIGASASSLTDRPAPRAPRTRPREAAGAGASALGDTSDSGFRPRLSALCLDNRRSLRGIFFAHLFIWYFDHFFNLSSEVQSCHRVCIMSSPPQ